LVYQGNSTAVGRFRCVSVPWQSHDQPRRGVRERVGTAG